MSSAVDAKEWRLPDAELWPARSTSVRRSRSISNVDDLSARDGHSSPSSKRLPPSPSSPMASDPIGPIGPMQLPTVGSFFREEFARRPSRSSLVFLAKDWHWHRMDRTYRTRLGLKPAVSCAALLAEVDSSSSSEVVFWSAYVAAFHLPTGGGSGRNWKGGPIERLQEVSDILATASSSSPTRVRAALKEFADLDRPQGPGGPGAPEAGREQLH